MKRIYVADIRPGDQVVDCFRVVECRLAPYRDESKGHYLHLVLADRSGQVEAKLWTGAEEAARWLGPGTIVQARARATLYQGHIRLRLDSLEPAGETAFDPGELLPFPTVDPAEALFAVHGAISQVVNRPLRGLLDSLFGDPEFVEAFSRSPHEQPGRLLATTVQLLDLAEPLFHVSSQLDVDLLRAGILLQGIGQTWTLRGETGKRAVAWLGVPPLSDQLVREQLAHLPEFPPDLAVDLRHIILAAHRPEATQHREAAVLRHLCRLQATLFS